MPDNASVPATPENPVPAKGIVISLVTREDVVIVDPDKLLRAARDAYRKQDPEATEEEAAEAITTAVDAAYALRDHYGSLGSDHPDVAATAADTTSGHPGRDLLPGDRVTDRADGLSPAGWHTAVTCGHHTPLQDYGCFLPDLDSMFTIANRPDTGSDKEESADAES